MKTLLLILLLFSTIAAAADENSSSEKDMTIGEFDLAAPVQFADEFNHKDEPFDPHFKAELDAKDSVVQDVCNKLTNFAKRIDCVGEVHSEFVRAGRLRGTLDFIRLNYSHLDNDALEEKMRALRASLAKARSYLVGNKPKGVLDRTNLEIEINEIQQIIGRRDRADLIAKCEKIFGEGHSRCKLP